MENFESLSWLWVKIGYFGAIAVIIGVAGEEIAERKNLPYRRKENLKTVFWIVLLVGLSLDLLGLIGSDITSHILENRVAELRNSASTNELQVLALQTNLSALNNKTLELTHQYDLSTNALAEANARLASVKPLKERLIEWLDGANPQIIKELKQGKTDFVLKNVPDFKFSQLDSMFNESGSKLFISSINRSGGGELITNGKSLSIISDVEITLKPELAQ